MFKLISKKLKCERGAIDKVIVTLFFLLISVVLFIGLEGWHSDQQDDISGKTSKTIENTLSQVK